MNADPWREKGKTMAKDREAVTCNGRAAFYAAMWDDIRQCAMDCGWAVALHGSLSSDMDVMAMPWVENAAPFGELVTKIAWLFSGNDLAKRWTVDYISKPHDRVVATIPIWADFYLKAKHYKPQLGKVVTLQDIRRTDNA